MREINRTATLNVNLDDGEALEVKSDNAGAIIRVTSAGESVSVFIDPALRRTLIGVLGGIVDYGSVAP